jgi:hypothetical protein
MDLSAEHWEGITSVDREALAKRLAMQLPSGFTFQAIRRFQLGERKHHVALYQQGDATFALIPGAVATLGYDADRHWEATPDELESMGVGIVEDLSVGVQRFDCLEVFREAKP